MPSTAEFDYKFSGWEEVDSGLDYVIIYKAKYTEHRRSYPITFLDYDGSVLQSSLIAYGTEPSEFKPKDPIRDYYTFDGWSPELTKVIGEATYTAQYEAIVFTTIGRPTTMLGKNRVINEKNAWDNDLETYAYNSSSTNYGYIMGIHKFDITIPSTAKITELSLFVKCSTGDSSSNDYVKISDFSNQTGNSSTDYTEIITNHYLIRGSATSPKYIEMPIDLSAVTSVLGSTSVADWLNPSAYPMPSMMLNIRGSAEESTKIYDIYLQAKYTMV